MLPMAGLSRGDRERNAHRQAGLRRADLAILVHPVRYARWRFESARMGPYANAWDGPTPRLGPVVTLLLAVFSVTAVVALLVFAPS